MIGEFCPPHSLKMVSKAQTGSESNSDELWMEEALRCARRALESNEVPVGAVVVHAGQIIARGWNRNITGFDPTAHAEIMALREAGAAVGNHRLEDCELFVTIEPCAMCAGADDRNICHEVAPDV
jgi:tRNA(adenine34) deaminase